MGGGTSRCAAGVFPCLPLLVKQWHANGRRPSPWAPCARARLSSPSARSSTARGARRSLGADACTSRPSPQGEACAVAMASRAHRASSPPGARPHAPRRRQPHALPAVTRGQSRPDAAAPLQALAHAPAEDVRPLRGLLQRLLHRPAPAGPGCSSRDGLRLRAS